MAVLNSPLRSPLRPPLSNPFSKGGSAFLSDSFADTDATLLTAHTGEAGATWTAHPVYAATPRPTITANGVYFPALPQCLVASGSPPNADYFVEMAMDFKTVVGTLNVGPAGRIDPSVNTMYWARYHSGNLGFELYKTVANTTTILGEIVPYAFPTGTTHVLRLTMVGSVISLDVDGVNLITVTDTAITAAGKAGFRAGGTVNAAGTGIHVVSVNASETKQSGKVFYISAANRTDFSVSNPVVASGEKYHASRIAFWNGRKAVRNIEVWYANVWLGADGSETANASTIPDVRCTFETSGGSQTVLQASGQTSASLAPGAWLKFTGSVSIAAGDKFFIRTYREAVVGGNAPQPFITNGTSRGEGSDYGSTSTTPLANFAGTVTQTDSVLSFGPSLVFGETQSGQAEACFGLIGHSVPFGNGDARKDGDSEGARSFLGRGLSAIDRHFARFCGPGGTIAGFAIANFTKRLEAAQKCCTHIIIELDVNDYANATLTSDWESLVDAYRAQGFKVLGVLPVPYTSSSNSFVDAAGQTTLQTTARAALITKINGLLGTKLVGIIDPRTYLADAGNNALWISTGAANYATSDGIHPSPTAHDLAKTSVSDAATAGYFAL